MATSGSKTVAVTSWDNLVFSWSVSSQSIANNTSTVAWTLKLVATSSGKISSTASKDWSVTINGTTYSGTNTIGISNNSTKTLASGSTVIKHNSDGSKSFSYSFSQEFAITFSGSSIGTISGSGTGTLNTIPRASSLTASNGTLNTAQTLTITRYDSSFTHTITYKCGTASGTIVTKTSSTSVSWTPPLSLASQNTNGTSVSITLTLTTYSGSTSIGTATKAITCTIPDSVKPSCTVSVSDPTGYAATYGNPVKSLSKFQVTVTPTTAYGSAITSYSVTANGAKYTSASFTTGVLTSSGTLTVSATVRDSRGRSGSATASVTVLNYTPPVIAALTVRRCNADGVKNSQGEYVQATFTASVTALNNLNSAAYVLKYKKSTETDYTSITMDSLSGSYSVTDQTYIFPADTGSSYDVELDVSDNFNTTKRATKASTAYTLMHFGADGKSLAIGKVAEESNLFDMGLPSRFNDAVWGNVLGLNKLPEIPADSDLNDYMSTGCWAVYRNDTAATIANIPVARAGRLEVSAATGEGIRVSQWSYLRQRYIPYNMENATWERDITRNESNVWSYGDWYRTTLSKGISPRVYHESAFLWQGVRYMTEGHTIDLSEAVSDQPNGIVLTFSKYSSGAAQDNSFNHFFVPRQWVTSYKGYGSAFTMMDINFGQVCHKYLYINDTYITGHANNDASGTGASGIIYNNAAYVLRSVIGV